MISTSDALCAQKISPTTLPLLKEPKYDTYIAFNSSIDIFYNSKQWWNKQDVLLMLSDTPAHDYALLCHCTALVILRRHSCCALYFTVVYSALKTETEQETCDSNLQL